MLKKRERPKKRKSRPSRRAPPPRAEDLTPCAPRIHPGKIPSPKSKLSFRLGFVFPSLAHGLSPPCSPPAPLPLAPLWLSLGWMGRTQNLPTLQGESSKGSFAHAREKPKVAAGSLGVKGMEGVQGEGLFHTSSVKNRQHDDAGSVPCPHRPQTSVLQ